MQINFQPIETRDYSSPQMLDIISIFYTIQGEGPFAGCPAVFIRLAGCNLQCPGCDTEYTLGRTRVAVPVIVSIVAGEIPQTIDPNITDSPVVVITGGEPFRQDITILCDALVNFGFRVQVETNGVLPIPSHLNENVVIVCSPKTAQINRHNAQRIAALKYVIHHESVNPHDGLPILALNHSNSGQVFRPPEGFMGKIYVQPMDVKDDYINSLNQAAAVKSALDFGYNLQLQIHKIIGVE